MEKSIFIEINKAKAKYEYFIVFGIISAVLGFIVFFILPLIGFILFGGGFILSITGTTNYRKLISKLKETIIKSILDEYVDNGLYRAEPGISEVEVYYSGVLKEATKFSSEDYIEGEINGVKFNFSDIHLKNLRSTGKSTYYVTYFKGQFYQFEFNKNFEGRIFVMEGSMPTIFHDYERLKLESEQFNSVFKVYTDNQHYAFYILTPHFMERLLELEKKHEGKISISFVENTMNLAIYNDQDAFECAMFRNFDETLITEFKDDLLIIKDLIETLKIDRIIYKENKGE